MLTLGSRFRRRWWALAIVAVPAAWVSACSSFDASPDPAAEAGVDAAPDAPLDAPVDLDAAPAITQFDDGANWSSFKLAAIADRSWIGAGFDGRYVYFSPGDATNATVARYDTNAPFGTASSWEVFDVSVLGPQASSTLSPVFDGRWMYFAPNWNLGTGEARAPYRYDTQRPFGEATSWELFSFDALGISSSAGSVFDGKRVSFVPHEKTSTDGGRTAAYASYDPSGDFKDASAWKTAENDAGVPSTLSGAALSNGFIYAADTDRPVLVRTAADFSTFERFETSSISGSYSFGVIADGRYVYIVPYGTIFGPSSNSQLVRYDSTKALDAATSYEVYDLRTFDKDLAGFVHGTFDGRFVYLTSFTNGKLVRFDTTQPLGVGTAYEKFDVATTLGVSFGFRESAVFDGQYVYFPPTAGGTVLRFKARDRRSSWPATTSSF